MRKKFKHFLIFFTMSTIMFCISGISVQAMTQDQAVSWAKSQVGTAYDVDGIYGYQCSDFGTAYINYILTGNAYSGTYTTYMGYNYFNLSYPDGWQRIENTADFVPEAGDILCFGASSSNSAGHVAVAVEGCTVSVMYGLGQNGLANNGNGEAVKNETLQYYGAWGNFQGVIRPKWDSADTTSPTISNVRVTDKTKDGYTVRCHVEDNVGVDSVRFPTWYEGLDANWLYGTNNGNGEWACRINVSDFNSKTDCTYYTHIYAYDAAGNSAGNGSVAEYIETTPPTISDVKVYRTTTGYMVKCKVSDNHGIDRVQFPTWTEENGQDDILSDWYSNSAASGSIDGDNVSFEVKISDHNNETGKYITHIYAFDTCDNRDIYCFDIDVTFNDEKPTIEDVKITDIDETGYTVSCKVSAANGINRVQFPTWTAKDGQDDIQDDWVYSSGASGTIADDGTVTYRVNISDHNNESGTYLTHIYAIDELGNTGFDVAVTDVNSDDFKVFAQGIYNGHKYLIIDNPYKLSIRNINAYCKFIGGYLATITSQTENAFVADLINQSGSGRCFIGATDKDEEGTWKWVNGEEWSYDNWSNGQPDNSTGEDDAGEDYAEMFSNGYWNDVTSNYDSAFVCEIEGYPVFEVTNNGTSADITNNGEDRTVTVIVADCSSGGVLEDVTASDITFAAGEKRTFMLGSGTHKVFVWDSLEGMRPLTK